MQGLLRSEGRHFIEQRSHRAVINVDDSGGAWRTVTIPAATYGLGRADWTADLIESDATGSQFVACMRAAVPVRVDAPGRFQRINASSVLLRCSRGPVSTWRTQRGRSPPFKVPGRMEVVRPSQDSTPDVVVVVDYAHTPDAVRGALLTIRALTQGKIWCVVGLRR